MIYKKCLLLTEKTTTDELGNEISKGYNIMHVTRARFSPWTTEEISLYGSEFTRITSKYALPVSRKELRGADSVLIEDTRYSIESMQELTPRWTAIFVKAYRS